jgi:hypothetical protein
MTIQSYNRFAGIMDELCDPSTEIQTDNGVVKGFSKQSGLTPKLLNKSALFCLEDSAYARALEIAGELPNSDRECFPGVPGGGERPIVIADSHGAVMLYGLREYPPGKMCSSEFGAVEVYRDLDVIMHYGGAVDPRLSETAHQTDVLVIGKILLTAPHDGPVLRRDPSRPKSSMRAFCIEDDIVTIQKIPAGFYATSIRPHEGALSLTREEVQEMPLEDLQKNFPSFVKGDFVSAVNTFLDELHYIDLPRHYIVESTPRHVVKNPEKFAKREDKRVTRFQDRPHWVIMDPEDIRRTWPSGPSKGGTHAPPIPHFRRGHEKLLTGERWTNKRGQIVRVRPSWVGDREWDHGAMRYRVISRQGSKEDQA